MDTAKRDQLVARLNAGGEENLPLLTLEEFFEGNDDRGSIWCNVDAPEMTEIFGILRTIREREDVSDVRVMLTQFDGMEDEWPFSDTIFIIGRISPEEVATAIGPSCAPDTCEISPDFFVGESVAVPDAQHIVYCWWD